MGGLGVKSIDKFKLSFGGEVEYYNKYIKKDFVFNFCEKYLFQLFIKANYIKNKLKRFSGSYY